MDVDDGGDLGTPGVGGSTFGEGEKGLGSEVVGAFSRIVGSVRGNGLMEEGGDGVVQSTVEHQPGLGIE